MTMTDPIADLLTRIRNAYKSKIMVISIPYSKVKMCILKVLQDEGYISSFSDSGVGASRNIDLQLKYSSSGDPAIVKIARVSKPGRRYYSAINMLRDYYNGLGIYILSTSRGIISSRDARKLGIGGEVMCKVF